LRLTHNQDRHLSSRGIICAGLRKLKSLFCSVGFIERRVTAHNPNRKQTNYVNRGDREKFLGQADFCKPSQNGPRELFRSLAWLAAAAVTLTTIAENRSQPCHRERDSSFCFELAAETHIDSARTLQRKGQRRAIQLVNS
jgi:hypothetical protein